MKRINYLFPILGLGILMSCSSKTAQDTEKENTTVKVKTSTAQLQTVAQITTYTANVQADVVNQITPAMGGRIEKIYVEVGDRVNKGQLLVQMESSNYRQQSAQLANLERDYQRYTDLLSVGGVAQQTVDQLKTQIDVLKAAIQNIEDNTQLRSPITGIITARNYDNGNMFAQLPILTVQQLNPVKAIIYVSEGDFTRVKPNMPVTLQLDVYGDEQFTGKVTLIYPTIDASTHTFGVEVTINNANNRVRPGMYARISLNFGEVQHIVIPDAAVQKQAGANDKYVFTIENGVAKYHKIELGQRLGDTYEIISGIEPGQEVVIAGQTRLIEGSKVEVINN
ncbi:MAG: efflux RND transporter periplasmic adaptor subunit [Candidatus Symbiothrix sp.]|jgi:RND family efflux transporter MFP subunit|nr:efflux RND transporter periplasmic adaptor subunit [Candidatus Symbiothrix sp.]